MYMVLIGAVARTGSVLVAFYTHLQGDEWSWKVMENKHNVMDLWLSH